jgi:hypothetical protein
MVGSAGAQTIWTGHTFNVEKTPFADETLPENQDRITDSVWITRAVTQGIFNIAQEEAFSSNTSPIGTEWAFPNNNPTATLSATNWQALEFEDWQTAHGGAGGGPPNTVGQNAVLHLLAENIYLDIRFTSWGVGTTAGGSFSYVRAEPPAPPLADFNNDGIVDSADYVMWRKDQNVGSYADWVQQFGVVIPGSGAATVPEPRAVLLTIQILVFLGASVDCCRVRGQRFR